MHTQDAPELQMGEKNQQTERSSKHKFLPWLEKYKLPLMIAGGIVLVLAALAVVPITRYKLAGLALKHDVSVVVVDELTNKPVSSADITIGNKHLKTDNNGHIKAKLRVGDNSFTIAKKYYDSAKVTRLTPLTGSPTYTIKLHPNGRQVSLVVLNVVNQKPVTNATVSALGSDVKTDSNGVATTVLPPNKTTVDGTVKANGFNTLNVTIAVTTDTAKNQFKIVPAGKIYFLSNASGNYDVVQTNLDGSSRKTVVSGAEQHLTSGSGIYPSDDSQYLAVTAPNGVGVSTLYLVNVEQGTINTIDQNVASLTITGWNNHTLAYTADNNSYPDWQIRKGALKTYNASDRTLKTLDETDAAGASVNYYREFYGNSYIMGNSIVYIKNISSVRGMSLPGRSAVLYSINLDGSNKTAIKSFNLNATMLLYGTTIAVTSIRQSANTIYFGITWSDFNGNYYDTSVYTYNSFNKSVGRLSNHKISDIFNTTQRIPSPSGQKLAQQNYRDGQWRTMISNTNGGNQQVLSFTGSTNLIPNSWYSDTYLLLRDARANTLYITDATQSPSTPLRITDFSAPALYTNSYLDFAE